MTKNVVLYHGNCLDGFGAAYAAWKIFDNDAVYIPVNYNNPPPDNLSNKNVYILDFSYPRDICEQIFKDCASLHIIDHHKTAQQNLDGLPYAQFDMNHSGCVLAWKYFHKTQEVPKLLDHIEDRDLWKFKIPCTKEICISLRESDMDFNVWDNYINDPIEISKLFTKGQILQEILSKDIENLLKYKYDIELNGSKGLACNSPAKYSSELGNKMALESETFGLSYYFNGNVWCCSLRSVGDFDVSVIASKFGGGGHKNASGFSVNNLNELK